MYQLLQFGPHLVSMAVLIALSSFFSCSEAALFYLPRRDRRAMLSGNSAQRKAVDLLKNPDRLLTAILFWNLIINIIYFAVASLVSLKLEKLGSTTLAGGFVVASLFAIILFSEMLPKNLGVLKPKLFSSLVSMPLALALKVVDPILPALRMANLVSRRIFFPKLQPEKYLEVSDLEKAISLSTLDRELLLQEQTVLSNIVLLSDIRVEDLMRPRTQYLSFSPPVHLTDLKGKVTPSGYLLITEDDSEEISGAIPLRYFSELPSKNLERFANPVCLVPWCTKVGEALDIMQREDREVVAVMNEFGETVGIVTYDDILDTLFVDHSENNRQRFSRSAIEEISNGKWHVGGITSLRRLSRRLDCEFPASKSTTVTGLFQEVLQRFPETGDELEWGDYHFKVIGSTHRENINVEIITLKSRRDQG